MGDNLKRHKNDGKRNLPLSVINRVYVEFTIILIVREYSRKSGLYVSNTEN